MSTSTIQIRDLPPIIYRSRHRLALLVIVLAFIASFTDCPARADKGRNALHVFPSKVQLDHPSRGQSMLVHSIDANGMTYDRTEAATFTIANESIAYFEDWQVIPVTQGDTTLTVEIDGLQTIVPIIVTTDGQLRPISFRHDVMPVISKAGCNVGGCHGAASGKDGFRLSLFGFDPAGDHYRLTREMMGRRVNLATPEDCLLVNKSTGSVAHTGGKRIDPDSVNYRVLVDWLSAGAELDAADGPHVTGIKLFPPAAVLAGTGASHSLVVVANYSDGTTRDVTDLTWFSSNNESVADVDQTGMVTAGQPGESFVMARFDSHTVGSEFIVQNPDTKVEWPTVASHNWIDEMVDAKLKKLNLTPSPVCDDYQFIRRAHIDICGVLPTTGQVTAFAADHSDDKRARLIDELIARPEFVDLWVMKWSEKLQVRTVNGQVSYKSALLYHDWIRRQFESGETIDAVAAKLLTATGSLFENPETTWFQTDQDPLKLAENAAQVFIGARIQCAQCHNHPFDRWTMDDYYSFAAFFSPVTRKRMEDPRDKYIYAAGGKTKHPVSGEVMKPKYLGGETAETVGNDHRDELAAWLIRPENPWFARNIANITWSHFFGRGIVEPVDDVRVSNPPSNGPLLDALAEKLVEYQFDTSKLVRDICNSRSWQSSAATTTENEQDLSHFSHTVPRQIQAEVLLDMVSQVTETEDKFKGMTAGQRAVEIADGKTTNFFLNTFGRSMRETVCSCETETSPGLTQSLHLINGNTLKAKISGGRLVQQMIQQQKTDADIVTELFLRALQRPPTPNELSTLTKEVAAADERRQTLEDVFWAILNSREFVLNH